MKVIVYTVELCIGRQMAFFPLKFVHTLIHIEINVQYDILKGWNFLNKQLNTL